MIRLHINIDHVATIRNARGTVYPDPVTAAALCELAGADGITAQHGSKCSILAHTDARSGRYDGDVCRRSACGGLVFPRLPSHFIIVAVLFISEVIEASWHVFRSACTS